MAADRAPRVLVIDDEAFLLRALERLLRMKGITVITAPGGAEGLDVLRDDRAFDLVICDLSMAPGMDGVEFFQRALEAWPELRPRCVVMSGDVNHPDVRALVAQGFRALSKPFVAAQVFALLPEGFTPR